MTREWRLTLELAPTATAEDLDLVRVALEMAGLDVDESGATTYVFVDEPHNPVRVRKAALRALHRSGVSDAIVNPPPLGRWDDAHDDYVGSEASEPESLAPTPEEVRWIVEVRPIDIFSLRDLRAAIELRGYLIAFGQSNASQIQIGARDETEANALADELRELPNAGATTTRQLGRLERWKLREEMLGNYAEQPPSGPFFF